MLLKKKKDNQRKNLLVEINSMLPETKSYLQGMSIKVEEIYLRNDTEDKRNKIRGAIHDPTFK